ncbi:hypothetical protein BV898_15494 [Hypsibius exemplaris]|uniref:EGF-like domain-containing protein n=1 Tax=Hypsibius exemplaris TaxID=2072580 RepID=A0A9X6NKB1_HYPEX|nr:hypothetical protein BV898_15494 [Hypsibius exemplaris]
MGESKWVFKGVPCPDRLFCTNGGTCVYFPRLSTRACECATGFEGEREKSAESRGRDVDLEDGRFRSSGMRRFIGWTFKRDLNGKAGGGRCFFNRGGSFGSVAMERVRELVSLRKRRRLPASSRGWAQRPKQLRRHQVPMGSDNPRAPEVPLELGQGDGAPDWSPSSTVTELNGLARSTLGQSAAGVSCEGNDDSVLVHETCFEIT